MSIGVFFYFLSLISHTLVYTLTLPMHRCICRRTMCLQCALALCFTCVLSYQACFCGDVSLPVVTLRL